MSKGRILYWNRIGMSLKPIRIRMMPIRPIRICSTGYSYITWSAAWNREIGNPIAQSPCFLIKDIFRLYGGTCLLIICQSHSHPVWEHSEIMRIHLIFSVNLWIKNPVVLPDWGTKIKVNIRFFCVCMYRISRKRVFVKIGYHSCDPWPVTYQYDWSFKRPCV